MNKKNLFSHNIRSLPKVDLHRHLDCSVRWSTLIELAPQFGINLPNTAGGQFDEFLILEPMKDLASVLKKFTNSQKVLASEEILTRIAFEACEDAYNDGVRVLELRYAPTFIADGHPELDFNKIHNSLQRGISMAKSKFPMAIGMICIVQRTKSYEIAKKVIEFAVNQNGGFIAVDLADNEDGFDPKKFAPLFQFAKKEGLHITIHSGESPSDLAAQWVKDSIDLLGAERIGHGIQVVRNMDVLNYVRDKKIPLEICPISNFLTQSFPTYESHPIRSLMNLGLQVTINCDDPGVFGTTLSDDYEVLHRVHDFDSEDFRRCNQVAFNASFIPDSEKQAFRNNFF
jgi:adenosine deaminase